MTRYHARTCPQCSYYVGYSTAKPFLKTREISVTSFCLNCGYKLPVHAVVQGGRRLASPFRRRWLQAAERAAARNGTKSGMPRHHTRGETEEHVIRPEDYGRHLRAIGQQLEKIQLATFNLECTGTSYLIRSRAQCPGTVNRSPSHLVCRQLPEWLRINNQIRNSDHNDEHPRVSARGASIAFTQEDLEHLDAVGKNRRLHAGGVADGHRLSQLLRTIGAMAYQRNHHLLGISWRDLSVCIVFETAQGKREIDVFRPDNLYDLWVRMYLKRENRVFSDVPY